MTLRAGAAQKDISPVKPVALYGYPHVERISTGVHDPVLASALFLDSAGVGLVMVALDLLMIEPPFARELRRSVAGALGMPESRVLISCTHTHSGPVTSRLVGWAGDPAVPAPDSECLEFVRTQTVAAV